MIQITWHGHSCFTVEAEDYTIVFDPYAPDWSHACAIGEGEWTAEIAVPLSSIGPIAPSMPVNFCRSRILKTPGSYHKLFISSPLARVFWDSDAYSVIEL